MLFTENCKTLDVYSLHHYCCLVNLYSHAQTFCHAIIQFSDCYFVSSLIDALVAMITENTTPPTEATQT